MAIPDPAFKRAIGDKALEAFARQNAMAKAAADEASRKFKRAIPVARVPTVGKEIATRWK